jgi:hypothetical protein
VLLLALFQLGRAQKNAPMSFGCGSKTGSSKSDTSNFAIMVGQTFICNLNSAAKCRFGFPYDAQYVQNTFGGGLRTSKGFYADYVLLQWSIANNASYITKFEISRRKLADTLTAAFQVLTTINDPTATSWQDQSCETSTLYQYKVTAVGVPGLQCINNSFIVGVGFRQLIGTTTGRITYAGGTAVPGVSILAQTDPVIPTSALVFNGTNSNLFIDESVHGSLSSGSAFTFQAWINPTVVNTNQQIIFNKQNISKLYLQNDSVYFQYSNLGTIPCSYAPMAGSYFHVTAQINGNSLLLQLNNGDTIIQTKQTFAGKQKNADLIEGVYVGVLDNTNSSSFSGTMDEIRIWNIALDSATIQRDYGRVLTGTEKGLAAYYQCNEGVGSMAFDVTHTGNNYKADDATGTNISWTNNTPPLLYIKGVTDANGNYQITGIPYAAGGSSYTFTPMFGVHTFNPTQALRYIATGSNVSNGVDFTDNSSFKVTGSVLYNNTDVPVQGVNVLIDGTVAIVNRAPVLTNAQGQFTVDVPIGRHRITLAKNGHIFIDGFPNKSYKNGQGNIDSLYDFENNIVSPISFYDTILATIAGRVAGGSLQQGKALGFGLSKANLGYGKITISLQTNGLLKATAKDSTITQSGNSKINSYYVIKGMSNTITIYPDTLSGEYAVQLPPGTYTVSSAYGNVYNAKTQNLSNTDYDFSTQTGGLGQLTLDINKKDSSQYKFTDSVLVKKKYVTHSDSILYRFNQRYDFIWRNTPTVQVMQAGQKFFGDSLIVFTDNNGKPTDSVQLVKKGLTDNTFIYPNSTVYQFGYPIYHQGIPYSFNIHVYEKYINFANGKGDSIPQTDGGTINISNKLASNPTFSDTLNNKGSLRYSFVGGTPNIVAPYILGATVQYNYALDNVTETVTWESGLTGIILGGQSTGSNFVTAGPTQVDMILRDPPGSASSVSLEKGTTTTRSSTIASAVVHSEGVTTDTKLGVNVVVVTGLGVAVVNQVDVKNDLTVGAQNSESYSWDGTTTNTTTNTEVWSTSSDPNYVASKGDVFIGHSTNITFSKTLNVGIEKDSTGTAILTTANSYAFSPQFGTAFLYTQYHIINELLPSLTTIRNSFFKLQPDVYIPVQTNNYVNTKTWYSAKHDTLYGDAYTFVPATQMKITKNKQATDSILIYNQWITNWGTILKNNEQVKAQAIAAMTSSSTNISFDAGSSYQNTISTSQEITTNYTFHTETTLSVSDAFGVEINKTGVDVTIDGSIGGTYDNTKGTDNSNETTFNYTLADNNQGDYISVDVLPAADGFGPVFYTRGGQTMCPYEGQEVTQYYEPGKHILNVATEQIELPQILVNNNKTASQLNVPSTQKAYFNLSLLNNTQTGNNLYYNLAVVDATNPNGAVITVDGQPLITPISIVVPALGSTSKTLAIAMGSPNVFSYHTIGIVLRSQCQGDPTSGTAVIADTAWVNVDFTPACTPITLTAPLDQWTMNEITGSSLPLHATGFNTNDLNFQSIDFEYKPSSSSTWLPLAYYFTDSTSTLYKNYQGQKGVIPGATVAYTWDASQMADQKYDIRARSNCADNVTSYSLVASGTKDLTALQVFGTPQPTNGILGIGQNISLQFNKPIEAGRIMSDYVKVNGILNGSAIAHATSLNLDGVSGYAKADGFSFTNSPFTLEFWMQRPDANDTGVIFSKGTSLSEKLEIANTAAGKMQVSVGSNTFSVDPSIIYNTTIPATAWHHYALVYDTTKTLTMYGDENIVPLLSQFNVKYSPQERSSVYIGRSVNGNSYGQAYIDEVRVWNSARSISDVAANMSVLLSGSQQGLVAYWPCNEGSGTLASDRAGSHTLTVTAPWEIALQNHAVTFDATKQQSLSINARQLDISNEQNATIEFWFKAAAQTTRACLLYNGVVDSTAKGANPNAFGLFVEPTGKITLTADGITQNATLSSVNDNAWHHFALVIDRLSNARTYLDGALQSQLSSSLFSYIVGLDMSIGACHIQKTSTTTVTNQYFSGSIDEIRIWETARQASLINRYKNTKLTGKEDGLLYYFPFEAYYLMSNVQVLGTTFNNKVDSTRQISEGLARTDTVVAIAKNGANYSLEAPSVKDAQPLTNLAVTFEVNNDRLLINLPTEYAALYENCILEMNVHSIYDKDGNILQSPAQWTAFVNQNPVVWSALSDTLSILAGQSGSFTATVLNKSGVSKDFSINGLPAWLTATPQSGSVQPNSTQTIVFTVNQGLNIGSYTAPINLTTDYGYDEKLQVLVNVKAQAPNWVVDASKYQYTMNVFGKVNIAGVLSTNENTMVSAFVNGQCRGVTTLKYMQNFDIAEAMLSIYSNKQTGDTIQLLVWDASTGKTYSNVTPIYTFTSDMVYGSPKSPVLISCDNTVRNSLTFNNGWNWISINVSNSQSNSVQNILGTVGSNTDEIWSQKSVYDQYSTQSGWSGSLDNAGLNPENMYKLHLSKAGVASIDGKIVPTDSVRVSIVSGWNWIGFVPQYNESVNEALASYGPQDGDLIKSQKAFSMYYSGIGWIGTLSIMESGKGYMLQTTKASTLVYPEKGLLKSFVDEQVVVAPKILGFTGGNAKSNATILAQIEDSTMDLTGKVLVSYSGLRCNGYAFPISISTGKTLFFLVTDEVTDSSNMTFALVDTSTNFKTIFTNRLKYSSNSNNGQINNPYLLKSSTVNTLTNVVTAFNKGSVYPNPFRNMLHVSGTLNEESKINIRIIDVLGKEVFIYHTTKVKGSYLIDINNQNETSIDKLPSGWYNVEVNTNSETFHTSILKQ